MPELWGKKLVEASKRDKEEMNNLIIDYSKKPKLFDFAIVSHPDRADMVEIDVSKIERTLVLKKGEEYISGHETLKRLKKTKRILLDARVLEELLEHPELIPDEWKKGFTYFWGTIFRDSDDDLYVRCLYWSGVRWLWHSYWLDFDWHSHRPAASLASSPKALKTLQSSEALPSVLVVNGITYKRQ